MNDGSVRHGAESFNFYFPQELDDEYLVVYDGFGTVPWKYLDVECLREFLSDRVDNGFTYVMTMDASPFCMWRIHSYPSSPFLILVSL